MAEFTSKMGLSVWSKLLDLYNYLQLADNWNKIDFHDHTPGRGVQIPFGGLAPGAVGIGNLASEVSMVPTGGITLWATSVIPSGYLLCDGTSYLRSTYVALFTVVGTIYGGSGAYFNVPQITVSPAYGQLGFIIKT